MRRRDVVAAMAVTAAATAAKAQSEVIAYDYFFVRLQPRTRTAFTSFARGTLSGLTRAAGGEIIGIFTPQLGWDSNELAILIRWKPGVADPSAVNLALLHAPGFAGLERHPMVAAARAGRDETLKPGGIYVHRWFEIKPSDRAEFIRLSAEGWVDFEKRFDTKIFGQMVEIQPRPKNTNLWVLLLTYYASHAVWEASRDPTTDAMKSFQRRAQLTLSSRGCSTLLAS
ncbi:MAG TPA: hypothetical protein VFN88_00525 [Caulobacteraceae bacterium]|nr:hypothetical protein [Caulobacteraceae bacterium]